MPKASSQKLKILYVMEYLLRNSDDEHAVSINDIAAYLEAHDIPAQRKSLYDDIEALRKFGLDIIQTNHGKNYGYYVTNRDFELPELKLLVDSVQSSKFITRKKTSALIKKIERLASIHDAHLLQRQVYVQNRIKTMNESIYYNVDEIHNGISQNRKIKFRYFDLNVSKERSYRKDGDYYVMSPYALTWDNQNYYLVAFDSDAGIIKHFRVDKMTNISMIDEPRDGQEAYKALDMAQYSKAIFGMFAGEPEPVRLRFSNHMVGAVLDRLGHDIMLIPDGDDHFIVTADVVVSPQFFAWIFGFEDMAQILGPQSVIDRMVSQTNTVLNAYGSQP